MRKLVGVLGGIIVAVALICGFLAYFVYDTDAQTNIMYDGLGRELSASPFFIRWVFDADRLWAGWFWFIADVVVFWTGVVGGGAIAVWGFERAAESNGSAKD